jgi:farnesyl diphosphate synthase
VSRKADASGTAVRPATIRRYRERIEASLAETLGELLGAASPAVADPIRYAVLGPGKRIRPLLLMAACRATGGDPELVADLACSVEFVHAYSLVHDDLPCMDDDVLRRGRPTLHVRYGPAAAVLAGAALMPLAVRAIHRGAERMALGVGPTAELVERLAVAAGGAGMVGGQLLDLRAEGRTVTPEELVTIHRGKTARLIAASVAMGAVAAGAAPDRVGQLERFGVELGLAFQATDDILDMRGTTDQLGKESGR